MEGAKLEIMQATVTISVEEYCDLRAKADANMFLMRQFGEFDGRFIDMDRRLYELENRIEEMRRQK